MTKYELDRINKVMRRCRKEWNPLMVSNRFFKLRESRSNFRKLTSLGAKPENLLRGFEVYQSLRWMALQGPKGKLP